MTDPSATTFAPPDREKLFDLCFRRVYRFGRRWDEALWRFHELGAVLRLLAAQPSLREGPILDLGCGDGEVFEWLFGRRPDADGVDSGATRLGDLELARRAACYREVRLEEAARMSFPDASYRLVFSNSVLEHIHPIEPVLREVARVLQPGGRFLFTTPDPSLYSADAYAWRRLLRPLGLDAIGQGIARKECDVYQHLSIFPGDQWRAKLAAAGLSEIDHVIYFPVDAARATSTFSGATRLPLLRQLVERVTPLARELAAKGDEDEWVARCRRVLAPLVDAEGSLPGCGQLILAEKQGEARVEMGTRVAQRRTRILWICKHRIARYEEVGALLRADAEVIPVAGEQEEFPNAVQLREEDDPLYPLWRPSCTIPEQALRSLREYDYFARPAAPSPEIVSLLDRFIDIVWVGTFSPVVVGLLRNYRGAAVLRTYGGYPYTGALGEWPGREPALKLLGSSQRYVFCPALPYQGLVEDPRISRGDTYWPACVTASRLPAVWAGLASEPVACETISLIARYRRQVYEQYIANYGTLPLRILGQNEAGGGNNDGRVVGTLPDDAYYQAIARSRLMLYAGLGNKYHLHYHALEAMAMRVPVVFFHTSALAHVALHAGYDRADLRAMGMCESVAEAHALASRLLASPQAAVDLSARQVEIRSIFEPAPWDGVVAQLVKQLGQRERYRRQYLEPGDQPPAGQSQQWSSSASDKAHASAETLLRVLGRRKT